MYYLLNQTRSVIVYVTILTILPLLWLPIYLYKLLVIGIVRLFRPEYGKIFNFFDFMMDENLARGTLPQGSLLCSLELEGDITLVELRNLFNKNVLEARVAGVDGDEGKPGLRYPELKQYPKHFMGYTFWKNVDHFSLEDHIFEMDPTRYMKVGQLDISLLHEEMINKQYLAGRSQWELVLIRGSQVDLAGRKRSMVIARFHHFMADAKSIMKLFVECLGGQPLKTAQPQLQEGRSSAYFILSYPFYFVKMVLRLVWLTSQAWGNTWKNKSNWMEKEDVVQHVRLSGKLALNDLKEVGKRWGGATSSVILAVMCGAIRKADPEIGKLFAAYILPKSNHPATLGNHAGLGALVLPTDEDCPRRRLQNCNKVFQELKDSDMNTYLEFPLALIGTGFNPFRKYHVRACLSATPVGITNIAGEGKGFSIGKCVCSEFIFSVGTLDTDIGVLFCVSSYKDSCRIAVISSGDVLSASQTEEIANGMNDQLEILKALQ